jgi:hypothetical protein
MMMTNTRLSNLISMAMVQDLIRFDCAVTAGNDPALGASSLLHFSSADTKASMNDSLSQMRYGKAQRV